MSKKAKKVLGGIIASLILIVGLYVLLAFYFKDVFLCGTWINGKYCTGLSVKETNELLQAEYGQNYFELQDKSNIRYRIYLSEIDGNMDFSEELSVLFEKQNCFAWIVQLISPKEYTLQPQISYDETALKNAIVTCEAFEEQKHKELDVYILETEYGYTLKDNRKGYLNPDKVVEAVKQSLEEKEFVVKLQSTNCYEDLAYTEEMLNTIELWEKIDAYQNSCKVIYDMGDKEIPVDASVVCHFIKLNTEDNSFMLDENGDLVFDKDGVTEFINELAAEYDTYGVARKFTTTSGEVIEITGGTYGSTLNQKAEVKYLTDAFLNQIEEVHIPEYIRSSSIRGKNDIGDTYIEIDMTNQVMYYYENGKLELETSVVTGNLARNHDTPAGVNYVYAKQKNRILRGPGYASFVNYWMPVKGGIGIHDATWRAEFGGEIYKTDGSHGCINTPLDKMEELYDMVEVGTPVVMYY